MGIAEAIPGVSGGTIAFITGIYERLMNVIKSFSPAALLQSLKEGGIKGLWRQIDGSFLFPLMGGMVTGILVGITAIHELLLRFPPVVWAFFFGLIIGSALYIGKKIKKWGASEIGLLVIGLLVSLGITFLAPSSGSEAYWFIFLSGMIAISALILPGISGSFILLLMGMYTFVLHETVKGGLVGSVKEIVSGNMAGIDWDSILVISIFGVGALTGLFTVANFLSWTFKKYTNQTLAILTGFMLGSLNKIWPWQEVTKRSLSSSGEEKIETSRSVFPSTFSSLEEADNIIYGTDPMLLGCIAFMVVGFFAVFLLEILDKTQDG